MSQTPLELLTVIAAPALITNASTVMIMSTSNRFARVVDRSRVLDAELAKDELTGPRRRDLAAVYAMARRRVLFLVRALTILYIGVGSFALGTFTGLLGAVIQHFGYEDVAPVITGVSLGAVTIGTLALTVAGIMMTVETRLAYRELMAEARALADR